jgi:hypothetical protein
MPPRNTDSSDLTRKRRAMALYAFSSANEPFVNAGTSVRREQTAFATLDVVTARKQGGCYCTDLRNGTYDRGGDCGCGGAK